MNCQNRQRQLQCVIIHYAVIKMIIAAHSLILCNIIEWTSRRAGVSVVFTLGVVLPLGEENARLILVF